MAAAVRVDTNAGETPLFTALQARLGAEQVVRERLDVGDVVLTAPERGATLIVERKSWPDLAKSLTDGRYAEQKARLLAAAAAPPAAPCAAASTTAAAAAGDEEDDVEAPLEEEDEGDALAGGGDDGSDVGSGGSTTGVLYLIEGPLKGWSGTVGGAMGGLSKMKNAQLEAALVLTAVRDGLPVLRAKDAAHTVELLVYLLGKLRAGELRLGPGGSGLGGGGSSHDYASLLKKRKRDNMSHETTWRVMLAQPPGMSARKAAAVAAAYPSMAALAAATEAELAAVRVPSAAAARGGGGGGTSPSASSSSGGSTTTAAAGRRLGPAVAKTLAALLR